MKWDGVHAALIGEPGSAKGQTIINYAMKHQLQHGREHLVILDVKPELEDVVRCYSRPDDRIFRYTSHAAKSASSALNLFADLDMAGDVAEMLTRPERSKEPYWAEKAADNIEALVHHVRGRVNGNGAGGCISLADVYHIAGDWERLEEAIKADRGVRNVARNQKEWGSIYSNTGRALAVLKIDRVRRMLAPLPGTTQPYFGPGAPRTIVLLQPSEELGGRMEALFGAMFHAIYHLAAAGGFAGGVGTKFIADEAASFLALEQLARYLEIGRGRKVQIMYVLQSRKQLVDVLGEDRADRTLAATELQIIGATSDLGTAEYIERLSGQERVHYRGPRNLDGDRPWAEHIRNRVLAYEITAQGRGDWTVLHHGAIFKFHVPEYEYYYRQQHPPPRRLKISGVPRG